MGQLHDLTAQLYDAARAYRDLDEAAAREAVDAAVARIAAVHAQAAADEARSRNAARLAAVEERLRPVWQYIEKHSAESRDFDDMWWCAGAKRGIVALLKDGDVQTVEAVDQCADDLKDKKRLQADLGLDALPDDELMGLLKETGTDDVISNAEPALRAFTQGVEAALQSHDDRDKAVEEARSALKHTAFELIDSRELLWGTYCVWNPQMEVAEFSDPAWCLKLNSGVYLDLMAGDWMVVMHDNGSVRWQGWVDLDHTAEGYPHGLPRTVDLGEWLRWFSNDGFAHLLPGCRGYVLRLKDRVPSGWRARRVHRR